MANQPTWTDPARLIWGDAVIDEAEKRDREYTSGVDPTGYVAQDDGGTPIGSTTGWRHPRGGTRKSPGLCCIVGHLNWIAAEQAGKDPVKAEINPWPGGGPSALRELQRIRPQTPDVVPVATADGRVVQADTVDILNAMINDHDGEPDIAERQKMPWWGYRFYERIVTTQMGKVPVPEAIAPLETACEETVPVAVDSVPVAVPVS